MRAYRPVVAVVAVLLAGCTLAGPVRGGAGEGGADTAPAAPASAGDGSAGGGTDATAVRAAADERTLELVALVNAHRRAQGCEPLRWRPDLAAVAAAHSAAMHAAGVFGHVDTHGRDAAARLREAGIGGWRRAAENLALTPRAPAEVLAMWLDSPGHRANIEDCALREHGVGRVDGYWTHVFTG